jgi:hypothetical protein
VSCNLSLDADDPNVLYYAEKWRTMPDIEREIRSVRYTRLLALMEEAAERPELQLSWVSEIKGLEYRETVRLGASGATSNDTAVC